MSSANASKNSINETPKKKSKTTSPKRNSPKINESSEKSEKELEKEVVKLNRYVNTAKTKCEQKKEELEKIKETQQKHTKRLKKKIRKMEKEDKALSDQLQEKQELLDKITALFYDLSAQGIDFEQYPDIDPETLKLLCGVPPQLSPMRRRNLDPIALRVIEKDQFFSDVSNNEEFIDRVSELQNQISASKSKIRSLSESLNSFSMSMSSRNSSLNHSTPIPSPLRTQIVEDSQESAKTQAKFAAEFNRLLNEKHNLIDQIVELKKNIKDRNVRYSEEMNSPTKTRIRLSMYNPDTKTYNMCSGSFTKTELSTPSSPLRKSKI